MKDSSSQSAEFVKKFDPELVKGAYSLFVSDVHLALHSPKNKHLFLHFLQHVARKADALYILGDLFDLWLGDDHENHAPDEDMFHRSIKLGLRHLVNQGTPVYIMWGNHDFLLGRRFMQETGCQRIPDPSVVELYGERVLLMHGDSLCTLDPKHLWFRKITQSYPVRKMFTLLPVSVRKKIAASIRRESAQHVKKLNTPALDVVQSAVEAAMRRHQVTRLIHGHIHREAVNTFELDNTARHRVVLGEWSARGNALIYGASGKYQLISVDYQT